jgi:hypothetical protein
MVGAIAIVTIVTMLRLLAVAIVVLSRSIVAYSAFADPFAVIRFIAR